FLVAVAPQEIPRLTTIGIDYRVLSFTLLTSVVTGIVFGLAPALQVSRPDLNTTLKEGGTRVADGMSHHRLRNLLVITEVSLALVLLIGAGLLLKSFVRLRQTQLGLTPDQVLVAGITLPELSYPKTAQIKAFYQQAIARLAARPEVQAAAVVSALPLG